MSKEVTNEIKERLEIKKQSIYDIILEYQKIANELEFGELTEELEEKLLITEQDAERKLLGYYYIIKSNVSKVEFYKAEIERLNGKIKSLNNTNDRLKDRVIEAVDIFGIDGKYKTDALNITNVKLDVLSKDDVDLEKSLNIVKEAITSGNIDNCTVETEICKAQLTIDSTPEELAKIYKDLNDNHIHISGTLNVSIISKDALDLIKKIENSNAILKDVYNDAVNKGLKVEEPEYNKLEFKGLSLAKSVYPKFT